MSSQQVDRAGPWLGFGHVGSSNAFTSPEGTHDLTIRWVDSYGLFDVGSEKLLSYVRASFEGLGVRFQWKDDPTLASPPEEREFVVHLRPSEPGELGFALQTMGIVFGVREHATNIWLFFPTIVRAVDPRKQPRLVGGSTLRGPTFETPELERLRKLAWLERERVARAMAAVVVHEVIHAVAPSTGEHAPEGVMNRKLGEFLLLEGELPLDERSATAFRRELARLSGQSDEGITASRAPVEKNLSAGPVMREAFAEVLPQQ